MFKNEGERGVSFPMSKALFFVPRKTWHLRVLIKLTLMVMVVFSSSLGIHMPPECKGYLPDNSPWRLPLPGPISLG